MIWEVIFSYILDPHMISVTIFIEGDPAEKTLLYSTLILTRASPRKEQHCHAFLVNI